MLEGCEEFPAIAALDDDRKEQVCQTMREDGKFIEAGENDNLIVQRLNNEPSASGIFGYSFLEETEDRLQGALVDGVEPNFPNIADSSYKISRPLFFYVTTAHVALIPGLDPFLSES